MNQAFYAWREEFDQRPVEALDRLIRGVVALGSVSQLSIEELLDLAFEPEDESLDAAVKTWLADKILHRVPEGITSSRWTAVLNEFLRAIATMNLQQTGQLLRGEHSRIRLWLRGLYEGPDRDPEGSYLLALAYYQSDEQFSQLWRRLVLAEELPERPYRDIGLCGFRKMPDAQGHPAADVPAGLIQVLLELANRQGVKRDEWLQIVHAIFTAYRRTEDYWIHRFRDTLSRMPAKERHIDDWLVALFPRWQKQLRGDGNVTRQHTAAPIPIWESLEWVERIAKQPDLCESRELALFLESHRRYARTTGDSESLVKTFNNLASRVIAADRSKASCAISWIKEALGWERFNPRNWTVYAKVLWAVDERSGAKDTLWEARQRFPWNPFVRSELSQLLRDDGDLLTSLATYREAAALFPSNVVFRTGLAETLRQMDQLAEAREVYEQARKEFPNNVFCWNGLAETLRQMGQLAEAREVYEQARKEFPNNVFCWNGLAETLRQMGNLQEARLIYEQACGNFPDNAVCRNGLANLLVDLGDLDRAEALYTEARAINGRDSFARNGLAEVWFIKSARMRDTALRDSARSLLQQSAREGDDLAQRRLRDFDQRWKRGTERGVRFEKEPADKQQRPPTLAQVRAIDEMGVAERLGRAMIALWQAERAPSQENRICLCDQAERYLDVAEAEAGELLTGFVETRGLVILARGDARAALDYFVDQIERCGRGGWIGIRLGEQRARLMLGEAVDLLSDEVPFDSQNARFAFQVANVIRRLGTSEDEQEVGMMLRGLYRRAASLAERCPGDASEPGDLLRASTAGTICSAAMIANFIQAKWFRPTGITSPDDLNDPHCLAQVLASIRETQDDALDVLTNAAIALAA
jgi:tetratricopeptide (TPR) repeat protein